MKLGCVDGLRPEFWLEDGEKQRIQYKVGPQFVNAKLVYNIHNYGFMVYITIVIGDYQPTYSVWGPHLVGLVGYIPLSGNSVPQQPTAIEDAAGKLNM